MKTTIEIATPLLERAKRLAAREGITLRELTEAALRRELSVRDARPAPFELRDARVGGNGLQPEFQTATWDQLRQAAYEGHGG